MDSFSFQEITTNRLALVQILEHLLQKDSRAAGAITQNTWCTKQRRPQGKIPEKEPRNEHPHKIKKVAKRFSVTRRYWRGKIETFTLQTPHQQHGAKNVFPSRGLWRMNETADVTKRKSNKQKTENFYRTLGLPLTFPLYCRGEGSVPKAAWA